MKRIISMLGIIGIVLFAVFSIIDHIFFLDDKVAFLCSHAESRRNRYTDGNSSDKRKRQPQNAPYLC